MVDSLRSIISPKLSVSRTNVREEEGERLTGRRHYREEFEDYRVVTCPWCSEMNKHFVWSEWSDLKHFNLYLYPSFKTVCLPSRYVSYVVFGSGHAVVMVEHYKLSSMSPDSFTVCLPLPPFILLMNINSLLHGLHGSSHWIVGGTTFPNKMEVPWINNRRGR